MKKKILSIFLTGMMMSMMLSGCGNAASDAEEPAESEETQESEEPEEIAEEEVTEAKEPEMITVYLMTKKTNTDGEEGEHYGDVLLITKYEYDKYGNRTKWTSGYPDSEEDGISEEYKYEYDDTGRVLKRTTYDYDTGEMFKSWEEEYEYDDKGVLIKSTAISYNDDESIEEDGRTHTVYESEYDDMGNVLKMISTRYMTDDSEETEESGYEYKYDTEGRIVKQTWIFPTGEKAVTEKQYDENGSEIKYKYVFIDLDGTEKVLNEYELIYEYEYDDAGNLVKKITYNKEEPSKKIAEDEYDANGNTIRSTQYSANGYINIYEYEYVEMQIPNVPKVN